MKAVSSAATALLAGAAAITGLLALISFGSCSWNTDLGFTLLIVIFFGWVLVAIIMSMAAIAGYYYGRPAMITIAVLLVLAGSIIGIRQAIPHTTIPDGGPGCRIDL